MGAVTYPNEKVIDFVNSNLVPLQVLFNAQPVSTNFNIRWTPTLITLDSEGKEHHRTIGFIGPEELMPSLLLGMAKVHFDQDRFDEAMLRLEKLLSDFPRSKSAPEAIYLRGVCKYKSTHEAAPLKAAYEKLQAEFPSDEWTQRAYPYRLL
ncbi:MAG: tetratricopeptide repeat protein [Candidatus Tectomicrobia bacterium]|uniref:Tetratricopeptide repeat protein n=1 Tax=Tectimicrobiota bacterium TaxID=2528274 RepID=A0A933GMQ8_UNCTE|nr:tetratricopeptide repeat protein [Candidatus Tectomicrobia bacterium]